MTNELLKAYPEASNRETKKPFTGNIWYHNLRHGKCDSCMEIKPLFQGFMILGKTKVRQCEDCFADFADFR